MYLVPDEGSAHPGREGWRWEQLPVCEAAIWDQADQEAGRG